MTDKTRPLVEYIAWIDGYLKRSLGGDGYGECRTATELMVKEFPELKRVAGHVYTLGWGKRSHFWCVTPDGSIVDPTARQFPGLLGYEPWKPGDEVCVGKCMNCGCEIWRKVQSLEDVKRECICGRECETSFESYLNGDAKDTGDDEDYPTCEED